MKIKDKSVQREDAKPSAIYVSNYPSLHTEQNRKYVTVIN